MSTKFFISVFTLVFTSTCAFSQNKVCKNVEKTFPTHRGIRAQCPNTTTPSTNYNSASTSLTVKFPATSGGKVEIYRNGAKVVTANAAAGAMLSYTLRNYGRGNYTVIVSSRNTVVYCRSMNVK
ncbi:MAG: hypothetical protein IKP62_07750 [Salinivirgaceae bacterium]|nr:hypothetical protein [Salinivirgaceae bacterium]